MKTTLHELLENIAKTPATMDPEIIGLANNSQAVQPGYLFLAYPGLEQDGRDYILDAIKRGAAAIVCEAQGFMGIDIKVPVITVTGLRSYIGHIAASFYDYPSRKMTVVGITGTNGKTSCSQFLAQALQANDVPCGIIGTLGVGFPDKLTYGTHTTPDPLVLQQQLYELHQQGAKAIAMEVSSHALEQKRVAGVDFTIAVFTNLSRDHLDYHGNMFNYGMAKQQLFHREELQYAVINVDDAFGRELLEDVANNIEIFGYSIADMAAKVQAHNIKLSEQGFVANITTPWGDGILTSKLLGRFNISNLLAVLTVLGIMELSLPQALASMVQLNTVPGRMQAFGGGKYPVVIVDFSHTPDALEQALKALREHCDGALWCVFGCGGDRDRGKRPIMGQVAENNSDHIIITDDNPRTEDPQRIVDDILQGLLCPWAAEVERDRGAAIAHAVECARPGDIVLIAGKGHEPYQIVGTENIPFSDIEHVKELL